MLTPCQVNTGNGLVRFSTAVFGKYCDNSCQCLTFSLNVPFPRLTSGLNTSSHGSPVYLSIFIVSMRRSSFPSG